MPLFEYVCQACGKPFEALLKSSASRPAGCPACGSKKIARQLSTFAAVASSSSAPACASGACPSGACGPSSGGCAGGSCPWN